MGIEPPQKLISRTMLSGSNLIVQTKGHAVRRVLPLENEGINECWISDRDRFAYEGLYHDGRLENPKIKHGGEWARCRLATALEYVRHRSNASARKTAKTKSACRPTPMNTGESIVWPKKLADGLGNATCCHPFAAAGQTPFQTASKVRNGWVRVSEDFGNNDAILVIGADFRKEQPLLTAHACAARPRAAQH